MPFTTSWPSGSSGWRRSSPQIVQRKSIQPTWCKSLATARFDQLMIMHLRLRRIPQAARLAAVDRQWSLRLGIAAEAARIRIILQRAAEIARAADRHMTVLHGNDPAGQRRSGVLRRVELLAVRAAGR